MVDHRRGPGRPGRTGVASADDGLHRDGGGVPRHPSGAHPHAGTGSPSPVAGGAPCDWYEVSAEARTTSGTRVRCTYRDDGTFRWTPLGTP
ncbi:hypothetical protein B4N89_43970 [Embleya scabrispora]|uniref:Uncharacterized protein n=1 Tax=Embleya scabrispora TaxID=159449 RepID=A0A1T3NKY9_9ACTN|nr:hypothetical protein B4N89_43970 [Embleya scabrispora]